MGRSEEDAEEIVEFSSPPCLLSELDPAFAGLENAADVAAWRKAERKRLIEQRMAIPADERERMTEAIAASLEILIGDPAGLVVSAYWPFRGEPDLKPLLRRLTANGATCALPLVAGKGQPLQFRAWRSGDPLERGVFNIPYPAEGEALVPDVIVAPVVGFDPQCFRLGYGGGFFDRTLASIAGSPRFIGVGYAVQAIPSIRPQLHDVRMQMVVTERETVSPR